MKAAVISDCGLYRYILSRGDMDQPYILFVMLNPSTADATMDDATVRSCTRIAKYNGYDNFAVVNLYAFRATHPHIMLTAEDPIGPKTDWWIDLASQRASKVIVAWGNHAKWKRANEVVEILRRDNPVLYSLGTNANGSPKHPLYQASGTPLVPWPRDKAVKS